MADFDFRMFPLDAPGQWNFKRLAVVFAITLILQMLFLPCLCDIGKAKMGLAFVVDFLVVVRTGVAYLTRERGNGWKFYVWLLGTSPIWITLAAWMVLGSAG